MLEQISKNYETYLVTNLFHRKSAAAKPENPSSGFATFLTPKQLRSTTHFIVRANFVKRRKFPYDSLPVGDDRMPGWLTDRSDRPKILKKISKMSYGKLVASRLLKHARWKEKTHRKRKKSRLKSEKRKRSKTTDYIPWWWARAAFLPLSFPTFIRNI